MTSRRRALCHVAAIAGALALGVGGAASAQDPISAPPGYQPGASDAAAGSSAGSASPDASVAAPSNGPADDMTSSDLPPIGGAPADTVPSMRGSNGGPTPVTPGAASPAGSPPADASAQTAPGTDAGNANAQAAPGSDTGAAPGVDAAGIGIAPNQDAVTPAGTAPPGGSVAVLRGLDKITARVTVIDAPIDKPVMFGKLRITARYCYKAPPEDTPEVAAFLQIDDTRKIQHGEQRVKMQLAEDKGEEDKAGRIFSGWMFASSPALNALEHPVYDVWLTDCKTSSPDSDFGAPPKEPQVKEEDSKHIR